MENHNSKSVSIIQIAEALGISKTTVGYVLSGQAKKRRVSDETAKKVLAKAKELNYVPHLWAKNLARQRTGVIGTIIGGFEYQHRNMNTPGGWRMLARTLFYEIGVLALALFL